MEDFSKTGSTRSRRDRHHRCVWPFQPARICRRRRKDIHASTGPARPGTSTRSVYAGRIRGAGHDLRPESSPTREAASSSPRWRSPGPFPRTRRPIRSSCGPTWCSATVRPGTRRRWSGISSAGCPRRTTTGSGCRPISDRLEVIDPMTVAIHLKEPTPTALIELSYVRPVRFLRPAVSCGGRGIQGSHSEPAPGWSRATVPRAPTWFPIRTTGVRSRPLDKVSLAVMPDDRTPHVRAARRRPSMRRAAS